MSMNSYISYKIFSFFFLLILSVHPNSVAFIFKVSFFPHECFWIIVKTSSSSFNTQFQAKSIQTKQKNPNRFHIAYSFRIRKLSKSDDTNDHWCRCSRTNWAMKIYDLNVTPQTWSWIVIQFNWRQTDISRNYFGKLKLPIESS